MSNFPQNHELVIARYNEDLHWIDDPLFDHITRMTIYNKGSNTDFKTNEKVKDIVTLPNLGRESHSYLHHIITNYDNLANMTIFVPGSLDNNYKSAKVGIIFEMLKLGCNDAFHTAYKNTIYDLYKDFQLDAWSSTHEKNLELNPDAQLTLSTRRPYSEWYKHFIGESYQYHKAGYAGIFAVDKRYILRRPLSFYQELIKELEVSSNPEVGHYFERAWSAIFDVPGTFPIYI
jgi:hypothetical protein